MSEPREQPSDDETALAEVPEATLAEFIQQPAKLIRIASMIRGLLDEVRQAPLDESGRKRLRSVHESSLRELKAVLSEDLQRELRDLRQMVDVIGPAALATPRILAHWAAQTGGLRVSEDELLAEGQLVADEDWQGHLAERGLLSPGALAGKLEE